MSARRRWIQAAVFLGVLVGVACQEEYPQRPQLRVQLEPNPLDFLPTYVGTKRQASLSITNKGLEDLVLTSLTLTGDPAFWPTFSKNPVAYRCEDPENPTIVVDCPNPTLTTIPANESSFYSLTFEPTQKRSFTGNLNIRSNAENAPSQDIPVLGTGCVLAADGGTEC